MRAILNDLFIIKSFQIFAKKFLIAFVIYGKGLKHAMLSEILGFWDYEVGIYSFQSQPVLKENFPILTKVVIILIL